MSESFWHCRAQKNISETRRENPNYFCENYAYDIFGPEVFCQMEYFRIKIIFSPKWRQAGGCFVTIAVLYICEWTYKKAERNWNGLLGGQQLHGYCSLYRWSNHFSTKKRYIAGNDQDKWILYERTQNIFQHERGAITIKNEKKGEKWPISLPPPPPPIG